MKQFIASNSETSEILKETNDFNEIVNFIKNMFILDPELLIDVYDNKCKRYIRRA